MTKIINANHFFEPIKDKQIEDHIKKNKKELDLYLDKPISRAIEYISNTNEKELLFWYKQLGDIYYTFIAKTVQEDYFIITMKMIDFKLELVHNFLLFKYEPYLDNLRRVYEYVSYLDKSRELRRYCYSLRVLEERVLEKGIRGVNRYLEYKEQLIRKFLKKSLAKEYRKIPYEKQIEILMVNYMEQTC